MPKTSGKYRFRKHDSIGANDAEDDERFLRDCFEDTGDLKTLLNCSHPARIVLGRTGSGKTALLLQLKRYSDNVLAVDPEHLSLNYIANSTIIQYLSSLGINLDPFYKLLWRHVFAVTIIQDRFDIVDEEKQKSFLDRFMERFESRESRTQKQRERERHKRALNYLRRWGDKFFQDVEHRTKEVTERFESEVVKTVKGSTGVDLLAGVGAAGVRFKDATEATSASKDIVGTELNHEIVNRAKTVIHEIQVQELAGIIELVNEILDDPQKPCYIMIDRLDEQWAEESIRHRLLKGLIDTVREFGKVRNGKIIVCLRIDLLERLFREMRSEAGFQEDKYRSLYFPICWTRPQLTNLLDKRIAILIRDQYTGYTPSCADIVPKDLNVGRKKRKRTISWILDRTWLRPRDAIEFFNACIRRAEGKAKLTQQIILEAEGEYSRGRLRAIAQEWFKDYPLLPDCAKALLANRESAFHLEDIDKKALDEWVLAVVGSEKSEAGRLWKLADSYYDTADSCYDTADSDEAVMNLRREVGLVFYRTGLVGLKTRTGLAVRWADNESYSVSPAELDNDTEVHVHPGVWRVLGINPF